MSEKERGRIKLLEKVTNDTNKITVGDAAKLFCGLVSNYCDMTTTGKKVKEKLTEGEYIAFITGMCNSLLASLYVSAAKTAKEQKERKEYAQNVNSDLLATEKELGEFKK